MAPAFQDLRTPANLAKVKQMEHFFWDLGNGTLPAYTLIQPRMATSSAGISNWQHPDVRASPRALPPTAQDTRASEHSPPLRPSAPRRIPFLRASS
jgi:hypothetical protein